MDIEDTCGSIGKNLKASDADLVMARVRGLEDLDTAEQESFKK